MPQLIVITRDGEEWEIFVESGRSVMEVIREQGFDEMQALCGGRCSCATCHVYIDPQSIEKLPPMSGDEDDLLDSSEHRIHNSRLSCQLMLTGDFDRTRVFIAPED